MGQAQDEWKKKLEKKLVYLSENLAMRPKLFIHLRQHHVLTPDDVQELKSVTVTSERIVALIDMLKKRPEDDYYKFLKVLIDTEQGHVASYIEGTDVTQWPLDPKYPDESSNPFLHQKDWGNNVPSAEVSALGYSEGNTVVDNVAHSQHVPSQAPIVATAGLGQQQSMQHQHPMLLVSNTEIVEASTSHTTSGELITYSTPIACPGTSHGSPLNKDLTELHVMTVERPKSKKLETAKLHMTIAIIELHKVLRESTSDISSPDKWQEEAFMEYCCELAKVVRRKLIMPEGFSTEIHHAYRYAMKSLSHNDSNSSIYFESLKIVLLCEICIHPDSWPDIWHYHLDGLTGFTITIWTEKWIIIIAAAEKTLTFIRNKPDFSALQFGALIGLIALTLRSPSPRSLFAVVMRDRDLFWSVRVRGNER